MRGVDLEVEGLISEMEGSGAQCFPVTSNSVVFHEARRSPEPGSQPRGDRSFHAHQRRDGKEFPYNYRSGEFLKFLWRRGSRSHRRVITKFRSRMDVAGKFTARQDSANQIWKTSPVIYDANWLRNEFINELSSKQNVIQTGIYDTYYSHGWKVSSGGVLQHYSIS